MSIFASTTDGASVFLKSAVYAPLRRWFDMGLVNPTEVCATDGFYPSPKNGFDSRLEKSAIIGWPRRRGLAPMFVPHFGQRGIAPDAPRLHPTGLKAKSAKKGK